jgi:hypothetical protein
MVVTLIRDVAHLTFEPQSAERWMMAGDHQTGHTFGNFERGLCLHGKATCILSISRTRVNIAESNRTEV